MKPYIYAQPASAHCSIVMSTYVTLHYLQLFICCLSLYEVGQLPDDSCQITEGEQTSLDSFHLWDHFSWLYFSHNNTAPNSFMLSIHLFLVAKFSVAACREGRMLRATFIEKKKQGKADMDRERPANKAPLLTCTSALLGHFSSVSPAGCGGGCCGRHRNFADDFAEPRNRSGIFISSFLVFLRS